jgi:spermidine synthase
VVASAGLILVAQGVAFYYADRLMLLAETSTYPGTIFHAETTPYQRIILTQQHGTLRLFLNGNLQFSSKDEYRYHEALVHPGLAALPQARRVLILGGGDGMAVREALRYPQVDSILLVDLDERVTQLFRTQPILRRLNADAFLSPKVRVHNADAFVWLRANTQQFDFIIIDLPDPSNFSLGKLYSLSFYREVARALAPQGSVVVQSTSPYVARRAYWCVETTLRAAGLHTLPYHAFVPSFGEWGYILAGHRPPPAPTSVPAGLRYFTPALFAEMCTFAPDMAALPVEVNRLNNQALVNYFEAEWGAVD